MYDLRNARPATGIKNPGIRNPRKNRKIPPQGPSPQIPLKTQKVRKAPESTRKIACPAFLGNVRRARGRIFCCFLKEFRVPGILISVAGRAFCNLLLMHLV